MHDYLIELGLAGRQFQPTANERLIGIGIILAACLAVFFVLKRMVFPLIKHFTAKTSVRWDDHVFNDKVLRFAGLLLPVLVAYLFFPLVVQDKPFVFSVVNKIFLILTIVLSARLVNAFISSFQTIASESEALKKKPLKGLYQTAKIIVIAIGCILIVSVIFDKQPSVVLTGLGASAAIMMLVFKDSIMGLVAGVQINVYDMVRPGDWIVMERHGANGLVTEVTLNIVKIQNWDNTIITIPSYALVSESFQNWRGMWDAGGRRIKESVLIAVDSIHQCDEEEEKRLRALSGECPECDSPVTNLFFFRYFLESYLKSNPSITPKPHLMVRHLPVTAHGLPIEIYCFSTRTEWVAYEHLKSEIVEFAYMALPRFGLKPFQTPAGYDISALKNE